jgi:PAS domain S-box-containing protein
MSDADRLDGIGMAELVEQIPDAVIFADRSGVIRAWNAASERIFGHPRGRAIGQRLDLIVPERFQGQRQISGRARGEARARLCR